MILGLQAVKPRGKSTKKLERDYHQKVREKKKREEMELAGMCTRDDGTKRGIRRGKSIKNRGTTPLPGYEEGRAV